MITKLVLKILLKATLPLVMVVGLASYALYAAGGDPISVLKQVGGGFGDRIAGLAGSAGSSLAAAKSKTQSTLSGTDTASTETLYRWKDASGVTHFSNTPPQGQMADSILVDPNQNLMSASKPAVQPLEQVPAEQPMPGVAGALAAGADPAQLIEQFKQAQEAQRARLP